MVRILSRELVKKGNEVRVVGIYPVSYPAPDYEEDQGVKVWRLRTRKGKFGWVIPYMKQYRMIKDWVFNGDAEIVEAPDSRGWFAFWPGLPVPLVLRANGANTYFARVLGTSVNRLTRILETRSYRRANAFISVSEFTSGLTREVFGLSKPFEVIYNGIEIPDIRSGCPREKNKVVFSGSLNRKKGIFQLVEGFRLLLGKHPGLIMEIYGKDSVDPEFGSVRAYLENSIEKEYRNSIRFKGHVSRTELFSVYETATVAVFPSFAEAFAFAPMEAMACECPTIYTKLGSGPEAIDHGKDGLLIDPDKPAEIASAIKTLIEDPTLAAAMGMNGRAKIRRSFSQEIMVERSYEFYKNTIRKFKNEK